MKSAKSIFDSLISAISVYNGNEKQAIAFLVLEEVFEVSRVDVLADKPVPDFDEEMLRNAVKRINSYEPIQYILKATDFYGRKFKVEPGVLIPRPETEELVHLIIKENKGLKGLVLADVGAGSGCISVTLAKELTGSKVYALDVSETALKVTEENAAEYDANVSALSYDITHNNPFPEKIDLLVSNPPYVELIEKEQMKENVLKYEPELALYAPETDPLYFYRKILEFGENNLKPDGRVYFEINERFGKEMKELLLEFGYSAVEVIKDLNGKDRIVKGNNI